MLSTEALTPFEICIVLGSHASLRTGSINKHKPRHQQGILSTSPSPVEKSWRTVEKVRSDSDIWGFPRRNQSFRKSEMSSDLTVTMSGVNKIVLFERCYGTVLSSTASLNVWVINKFDGGTHNLCTCNNFSLSLYSYLFHLLCQPNNLRVKNPWI